MKDADFSAWKGKVIGASFGILAGVFGVFLGLLIGHLFDVLMKLSKLRAELGKFLHFPEGSPLADKAEGLYLFACLAGSVVLASGDSPKARTKELIVRLQELYPVGKEDLQFLGELFAVLQNGEAVPNLREHAEALKRRSEGRDFGDFLERLEELVRVEGKPLGAPLMSVLGILAASWGLDYRAEAVPAAGADPWAVLGLRPEASQDEVKRVFRLLASQFHPDGGAALTDLQKRETEEAFKRIRQAYEECFATFKRRGG